MTVEQLMELLKKETPTDRVVIQARTHVGSVYGPCQSVKVDHVGAGFDWDSGTFFIYPEEPMRLVEFKDMQKNGATP